MTPRPLKPLGHTKEVQILHQFYLENGDSPPLKELDAAISLDWQSTRELASACGRSVKWVVKALECLALQGRVQRSTRPIKRRRRKGFSTDWEAVWRHPQEGDPHHPDSPHRDAT